MSAHALLSPSSAERWLACTPSARFEEQIPVIREGEYTSAGTLAHELAALTLGLRTGAVDSTDFAHQRNTILTNPAYDPTMAGHADDYAALVMEGGGEVRIEHRIAIPDVSPLCWGTADAVSVWDDTLRVFDYKYGEGVQVRAAHNPQLMLYALGMLHLLEVGGPCITRVVLTIYQPRAKGESTWGTTPEALRQWAAEYVRPRAEAAIGGRGDFVTGDHCQFCRARTSCRAYYAEFAGLLNLCDKRELSAAERRVVLDEGPRLKTWINAVQGEAVDRLLAGHAIDGYKVVEGRGSRAFSDERAVALALIDGGVLPADEVYTYKLRSLTDLEKLLGKRRFAETLGHLVTRKAGAPTLAPADDPRPEWGAAAAAEYDLDDLL